MRIAFITGGLEPGRDGVGDYTRTLALECRRRGHDVCLLSLGECERSADTSGEMPTRRLRLADWRGAALDETRRWLAQFAPEWASLQFVPYSFDPRGFFQASVAPLSRLIEVARHRQVFFHETWIGSQEGAPLKARVFGWWQRRATRALLRALAPACVHTSTSYYREALRTLGAPARVLPMFGAVPAGAPTSGTLEIPGVPANAIVCGHFGTLHPGRQADAFLADFHALAAERGRPAALAAAGSLGYGAADFAAIAERWKGRVTCVSLGRLETEALAQAFARFDFAVTSVPWNILGKSSSAAALREHGLRVVATEAGSPPRFTRAALEDVDDFGFVPWFRDRASLARALEKTPPRAGASAVARQFLADLDAAQ